MQKYLLKIPAIRKGILKELKDKSPKAAKFIAENPDKVPTQEELLEMLGTGANATFGLKVSGEIVVRDSNGKLKAYEKIGNL